MKVKWIGKYTGDNLPAVEMNIIKVMCCTESVIVEET